MPPFYNQFHTINILKTQHNNVRHQKVHPTPFTLPPQVHLGKMPSLTQGVKKDDL